MLRNGKVIQKGKDHLMVCFDRLESCEKCGACEAGHKKQTLVRVLGDAAVGDVVAVVMPDNRILALSAVMYGVPLIGLIAGLLLGMRFFQSEVKALVTGVAGLVLFFFIVKAWDKRIQSMPKWQPHVAPDGEEA